MKEIIEKLAKFENLSGVEMTDVIERIVTGRVTEAPDCFSPFSP